MVYVRLAQEWTDQQGNQHAPETMVDVDAATLAELEAIGVVAEASLGLARGGGGGDPDSGGFPGPDGGDNDTESGGFPGPDGGDNDTESGGFPGPDGGGSGR